MKKTNKKGTKAAKHTGTKAAPKTGKTPRAKKEEVHDPVPPVLADGAYRLFANALVAARKRGEAIVQGFCGRCNERRREKSCCILCALAEFKGRALDERDAAKLLLVPERWLLDLISGFDHDGDVVTYRAPKRIGAKLWRKYGTPTEA